MKKRKKARGIEAATVAQSRADDVVVVGSDGLQDVQHGDWVLQLHIGAPDQASGIQEVAFRDQAQSPFQLESRALHEQFGGLVHNLKGHLIFMEQVRRRFLQGKKFVGAQIALVVGGSLPGQDGLPHFFGFVHGVCEGLGAHGPFEKSYHPRAFPGLLPGGERIDKLRHGQ